MTQSSVEIDVLDGLGAVTPEEWDALVSDDDPFVEHAFLRALETSGSVGASTGWTPMHLAARRDGRLVGALPLYLKHHSFGEYVFDFGWAQGAARAGIDYYPKLVSMVPMTPATGSRLLVAPGEDFAQVGRALLDGALALSSQTRASSVHLHFLTAQEHELLARDDRFLSRLSTQFHWYNRGFRSFEEHLATFRAAARKQVRRERRRAAQAGLAIGVYEGPELSDAQWSALASFYFATCDKHGSGPYLTPEFFGHIRDTHAHRVVAVLAERDGVTVAGTLNFEKGKHLYGRYWGAREEHDCLHFELCYHRLIERAIDRGLSRFEAGAQGVHKLRRGLLPAPIYNACHIVEPRLRAAVAGFLAREQRSVRAEMAALSHHGPSRRGEPFS